MIAEMLVEIINQEVEEIEVIFLTWLRELSKLQAPLRNERLHICFIDVRIKGFE